MPVYLENLNLDFLSESEEKYKPLIGISLKEGAPIVGYYGLPYINKHFGNAQIILRTDHNDKKDEGNVRHVSVVGLDTHSSGNAIWEARVMGIDIDKKEHDVLQKRVAVTCLDGSGMAVVNIVNADVLPSYMKGDIIKMQMIAFPEIIEYYKDEEDYLDHQPEDDDGESWFIDDGLVFPSGFLRNRDPNSDDFESDDDMDAVCAVRGTVKRIVWGRQKHKGKEIDAYLRCIIDTEYGELEIVHTIEQVREEMRCNMEPGATVFMVGILSGDVAIDEYDHGVIRDEDNNLAAMRYMFSGNDPERIRSILSEDVLYCAGNGKEYRGIDNVIAKLKYVQKENDGTYFAHHAVISAIDDGEEKTDYPIDTKCLVLANDDEKNYESIAFFDYDQDFNIKRIVISANPRYHFKILTLDDKAAD